jgi:hypothetical protein
MESIAVTKASHLTSYWPGSTPVIVEIDLQAPLGYQPARSL